MKNSPSLWLDDLPIPSADFHKYNRGHAVVLGADELMGATRLAASACSRVGAGLVSVLSNSMTTAYRIALPADILVRKGPLDDLTKVSVILGGCGGISKSYQSMLLDRKTDVLRVFDAAAIPRQEDWSLLRATDILTPHSGEFGRTFGAIKEDIELSTMSAAHSCGAIVVLKGPQTIVAHPDGRYAILDAPNPYLAKAGTGDVLAGFITGLVAQGMAPFEAANCAVWMHSECGRRLGPGLTACDLEFEVPYILQEIIHG